MSSALRVAPLMTRLNDEWERIHSAREHLFGDLGTHSCGHILNEIRAAKNEAQDHLLYELLTLARGGDKISERVLVQLLIPVAQRMAHRVRTLGDMDRADRVGYAISKAWELIGRYPLDRRKKVHANLTMELLSMLAPKKTQYDLLVADRTTPVADEVLEAVAGEWSNPAVPFEVLAHRLFTWAIDTGVLTREETALLARVALGEEKQIDIAAELSVSVDCVNKRVARARARLRSAYREQF